MLFVIVAHTNFSTIPNPILRMILDRLGAVAVPVFLLVAGYYFHTEKFGSVWILLKKKAVTLCLPWIFCGMLVYGYSALRSDSGLTFSAAVRFLLGNGSYLYYLTILLALQVIFYFLRNIPRPVLLWSCVGISCVSLLLSASDTIDPVITTLHMTNYLNIFNWCGFFAIGFAAQHQSEDYLLNAIRKLWVPAGIVWTALLVAGYFWEDSFGYFSWLGYGMELCSCILLLRLGQWLENVQWLRTVGKYSFSIYLFHIQIIPIVAKFLGGQMIGLLISPIISYAVTFMGIWIVYKIAVQIHWKNAAESLLGVRI